MSKVSVVSGQESVWSVVVKIFLEERLSSLGGSNLKVILDSSRWLDLIKISIGLVPHLVVSVGVKVHSSGMLLLISWSVLVVSPLWLILELGSIVFGSLVSLSVVIS